MLNWLLKLLGLRVDNSSWEPAQIFGKSEPRGWFRITESDDSKLEGQMLGDSLQLSIKFMYEQITIKVSPENADKMTDWMVKHCRKKPTPPPEPPTRDKTSGPNKVISIQRGKGRTRRGPRGLK